MGLLFPLIPKTYRLLFIWHHNDTLRRQSHKKKTGFYGVSLKIIWFFFQILAKNPRNLCNFMFFFLFVFFCFFWKEMTIVLFWYIHKMFQVHSTNILGQGAKSNFFFAKTTGKDDPAISCNFLMVEFKYFSCPENPERELHFFFFWHFLTHRQVVTTPFGRRGLMPWLSFEKRALCIHVEPFYSSK